MEKCYKRIQERAFIILDLLLVSLQRAIDYLRNEIPRLKKMHEILPTISTNYT